VTNANTLPSSARPDLARLLIMGPPGAGKGTQASSIAERLGVPAVSTGDIFRGLQTADTPLAVRVRGIMAAGGYVDDETTNAIVAERLSATDCRDGSCWTVTLGRLGKSTPLTTSCRRQGIASMRSSACGLTRTSWSSVFCAVDVNRAEQTTPSRRFGPDSPFTPSRPLH
jgi:hypothetical protein